MTSPSTVDIARIRELLRAQQQPPHGMGGANTSAVNHSVNHAMNHAVNHAVNSVAKPTTNSTHVEKIVEKIIEKKVDVFQTVLRYPGLVGVALLATILILWMSPFTVALFVCVAWLGRSILQRLLFGSGPKPTCCFRVLDKTTGAEIFRCKETPMRHFRVVVEDIIDPVTRSHYEAVFESQQAGRSVCRLCKLHSACQSKRLQITDINVHL